MNVFIVHHRSSHHARQSGYGRLVDFIEAEVIYGNPVLPYRAARFFSKFFSDSKGIYNSSSFYKNLELYSKLKKVRYEENVVHFLNGERDIRHLRFFKKRFPKTRFCATFHKPPEILKDIIPDPSELRFLDGAICVGINQVDFLKKWLETEIIQYIPHGVDTGFFNPDPEGIKEDYILFVGQHLRDFRMLNNTVPALLDAFNNLHLKAVVHHAFRDKVAAHPKIEIYSGISDCELREFYQKTRFLYLPMTDSTACNSVLEALACGLPIVTSRVGGTPEYLKNTENYLIAPGETAEKEFVQKAKDLLRAPEYVLSEIGKSSRKKVLEYEWEKLATRVRKFYASLG